MNFPELVLGTAQLANAYGVTSTSASSYETALDVLDTAWNAGIRTVDTAPVYGRAEAIIGAFGWSGSIHTKVPEGQESSLALASSLTTLGVKSVGVLYLHDARAVLERTSHVEAAAKLVGDRANRIGASVYEVDEFDAAIEHPSITVAQVPLNVLDRRFTGSQLERARGSGVRVYARSVFLQGVLLAPNTRLPTSVRHLADAVRRLHDMAAAYGVSAAGLLLGWVRAQGVDGVIIGVATPEELRAILTAWHEEVPPQALRDLDGLPSEPWENVDPRRWSR